MKNKMQQKNSQNSDSKIVKRVSVPVAKATVRRTNNPVIRNMNLSGDIVVAHREYIADVNGSVGFSVDSYAVNPGQSGTFPWLSSIARRFESYQFDKLIFSFETESATSKSGSVLGALDYDASDNAPDSKVKIMSYRSAVRSPPWSNFSMESKRQDLSKRKSYYVRSSPLGSNQDIKLYDVGNFFIAKQGQSDTSVIGELYVDYVVSLMTPQLSTSEDASAYFSGTGNSTPFGSSHTGDLDVSISSSGTTTSVNTFTFGSYTRGLLTIYVSGTGLTNLTYGGTASFHDYNKSIHSNTDIVSYYDFTANAGETITITIANTTLTSALMYVTRLSL